jgi:predicted HTH transcriptional regulator
MISNSLISYFDKYNQRKFNSQKAKIVRFLSQYPEQSRFTLGYYLGISDHAAQKRISDLVNEGIVCPSGTITNGNNQVSIYSLCDNEQEHKAVKISLKSFLKENHPEILEQYEKMQ